MRVLHFSDTHIGHQAYAALSHSGLNQREVDFQAAFQRVVDEAVQSQPDLVVHAGDLFDVVRPSNRAIANTLHSLRRLSEARIPLVVVSGNHEAPRLRETGSIFRVFEGLPFIHPVYRGAYERIPIETRAGPVTVHAVPQALEQAAFGRELLQAVPEGNGPHILVAHGTVAGVDGLFSREINELTIPQNALRPEYDYIALGHFHNHRRIGPNGAYSGSTERTSFAEANEEKVFLEVDLGGGSPRLTPRPTTARPMVDLGILDAARLPAKQVMRMARERLESVGAEGAVVRLIVRDLDPPAARALDLDGLRGAAPGALNVEVRLETRADDAEIQALPQLGSLEAEFEAFLAARPLSNLPRDALLKTAHRYFEAEGGERLAP